MNVQCKNKKCNKINNELVQVVKVCFVTHAYERKNRLKGKKVVEIYIYIYMSFARRHLL